MCITKIKIYCVNATKLSFYHNTMKKYGYATRQRAFGGWMDARKLGKKANALQWKDPSCFNVKFRKRRYNMVYGWGVLHIRSCINSWNDRCWSGSCGGGLCFGSSRIIWLFVCEPMLNSNVYAASSTDLWKSKALSRLEKATARKGTERNKSHPN